MLKEDRGNAKDSAKDGRNFGLAVGGAFISIGALLLMLGKEYYLLFLASGGVLLIPATFRPVWLRPIQRIWMTLATAMGWLTTRLTLALLFYFVLTPIAFFLKFIGDNALELTVDKSRASYWRYREEKGPEKSYYEKQF